MLAVPYKSASLLQLLQPQPESVVEFGSSVASITLLNFKSQTPTTFTKHQLNNLISYVASNLKSKLQNVINTQAGKVVVGVLIQDQFEFLVNFLAIIKLNLIPIAVPTNLAVTKVQQILATNNATVLILSQNYKQLYTADNGVVSIVESESIDVSQSYASDVTVSHFKFNQSTPNCRVTCIFFSNSNQDLRSIKIDSNFVLEAIHREKLEPSSNNLDDKVGLFLVPFQHLYSFTQALKALVRLNNKLILHKTLSLTPSAVDELVRQHGINYLVVVPSIINNLLNSEVAIFDKLDILFSGGTTLPKNLILKLNKFSNLTVINDYGTSDTGNIATTSYIKSETSDPSLFHTLKGLKFKLINRRETAEGQQLAQLLILKEELGSSVYAENDDEFKNDIEVNDLLHIIEESADGVTFRILNRTDATIIHLNGSKTNPLHIELEIESLPFVNRTLVEGIGKLNTCLLVEFNRNKVNSANLEECKSQVLLKVEEVNRELSSNSKIVKELVYFFELSEQEVDWPIDNLGRLFRLQCNLKFKEIIDTLFNNYTLQAKPNNGEGENDDYQILF